MILLGVCIVNHFDAEVAVFRGQRHCSWCLAYLHHQITNSEEIYYVGYSGPSLSSMRTVFNGLHFLHISMSRNGRKYKCILCFQNKLQRLMHMLNYDICINSFWPTDTMWRQRSGATLAQVMTAPSHLPKPMLTFHQRRYVALTQEHYLVRPLSKTNLTGSDQDINS